MKFGLSTVTRGVFSSRENYMAVAKAAERAGFDFLSVSDHLIVPGKLESHYPYTVSGVFAAAEHGHCFDQLATIAFLAGCTERLRLSDIGAGGAAPPGGVDREDTGDHRRARQRPAHRRRRCRLDEGGIRAAGRAFRGTRQGHGRVSRGLPRAVDQGGALLSRQARELLRRAVLSQARAEAASADLGRRREPGRAAPRHQIRRRLVPRQQQPDQAARHGPAPGRRHRRRQAHVRGREARSRQPRHYLARPGCVRLGAAQDPGWLGAAHVHGQARPTWRPTPRRCRPSA